MVILGESEPYPPEVPGGIQKTFTPGDEYVPAVINPSTVAVCGSTKVSFEAGEVMLICPPVPEAVILKEIAQLPVPLLPDA
jgi:hypothetical protein